MGTWTANLRDGRSFETVKDSPVSVCFKYEPTQIQSPHPPAPLWSSHTQGHHPSALIALGPGSGQPGAASCPRALKLFELANPKLAYPTLLLSSRGNHNRGPCPHFAFAPFPSEQSGDSLCGLSDMATWRPPSSWPLCRE